MHGGLFPAACLFLTSGFYEVFACDFFAICSPCERQYSIGRDVVIVLFYQTKVSVPFIFYETLRCADLWQGLKGCGRGQAGTKQRVSLWRSGSQGTVIDGTVENIPRREFGNRGRSS
jgi:hypothetical protein